jgi:hypothetical protein
MMKRISYTNFVLTVIAGLLAWNIAIRTSGQVVHAQNAAPQFYVTDFGDPINDSEGLAGIQRRLNAEVKGGDIVGVAPTSYHEFIVIYKRPK